MTKKTAIMQCYIKGAAAPGSYTTEQLGEHWNYKTQECKVYKVPCTTLDIHGVHIIMVSSSACFFDVVDGF